MIRDFLFLTFFIIIIGLGMPAFSHAAIINCGDLRYTIPTRNIIFDKYDSAFTIIDPTEKTITYISLPCTISFEPREIRFK